MAWQPQLVRRVDAAGNLAASLGHVLVDDYLEFVAARCRPNTLLATAFDLKVFFSVVPKEPADVVTADIFAFITAQKKPRQGPKVVRLEDGETGLSARTIKRRLASISGPFGYLMTRDASLSTATRCRRDWQTAAAAAPAGHLCCARLAPSHASSGRARSRRSSAP
jgi:integrase/recombinase XerD